LYRGAIKTTTEMTECARPSEHNTGFLPTLQAQYSLAGRVTYSGMHQTVYFRYSPDSRGPCAIGQASRLPPSPQSDCNTATRAHNRHGFAAAPPIRRQTSTLHQARRFWKPPTHLSRDVRIRKQLYRSHPSPIRQPIRLCRTRAGRIQFPAPGTLLSARPSG